MKKKITKFLIPVVSFLGLSLCTSCGEQPFSGRVLLDYGDYSETPISSWTELPNITHDELESNVINKESFVLAIYGSPTCGCWRSELGPNLVRYNNETHTRIYVIDSSEFDGADKYGLYTVSGDMPSVAIFNRGKLVYQIVYERDNKDLFRNYSKLREFFESKTIAPKIWYVNMATLDSFISENKSFNVYLTLGSCPDCKSLREQYLKSWIDKTNSVSNILYAFDFAPYDLQTMKDKYGLSYSSNNKTGWNNGYVPSIQNRTGSTINDMITVYNDKYDTNLLTVSSYFSEERVQNLSFLKDDETIKTKVLDGLDVYKSKEEFDANYSKDYVLPIINLYFNTYLK